MFIAYHTRNFDDTAARIKKLVAVLDKYWYQGKKKEFEKLCDDGEDCYYIDNTPDNYEEYFQSLDPEEQSMTSNDFTDIVFFDKFCFYPDYSSNKVCGEGVTDNVIAAIKGVIADAGVSDNYNGIIALIADVKIWVDQEVNENIDFAKNEEYSTVIWGIVRKIKWKIDYSFNNKLKALELMLSYKNPIEAVKPKEILVDTIFDIKVLNQIFYPHAINPFIEIEKQLIIDEWFSNKVWNDDKNILVSLILILQSRGYLKPIKGKSISTQRLIYRRFFEYRYGKGLKKQMQPSQIKRFNLPKIHEPKFDFIQKHSSGNL